MLDSPALATTLMQGAIADFECALINYITVTEGRNRTLP